jgi:hypothetical protein
MSSQSAGTIDASERATRESTTGEAVFGIFDARLRHGIAVAATLVLRYGLIALLLMWGAFKFVA